MICSPWRSLAGLAHSTHRIGRIRCCCDVAFRGGPVRGVHSLVVHLHRWREASTILASIWLVPLLEQNSRVETGSHT